MADHLERVARLSEAVRRSAEVHKDACRARDQAMLEANDAGYSIGELAKAGHYTRPGVREMITNAAVAQQNPEHPHHRPHPER